MRPGHKATARIPRQPVRKLACRCGAGELPRQRTLTISGTLKRRKVYDLVWSKPRTTLAREMGVSDVWIGKQCRALNVPAPPPGYWARRASTSCDRTGLTT